MGLAQDQLELFLDDGWAMIGPLHRWLSTCQGGAHDRPILVDVLKTLQRVWSAAEDHKFTRIAYSCLMLEQILERFCAGTLELTAERLSDVTAGVETLQEQLLALEATREESTIIKLDVLLRLYRHGTEPIWKAPKPVHTSAESTLPEPIATLALAEVPVEIAAPRPATVVVTEAESDSQANNLLRQVSVESTVLAMLEQFVINLDETCHRLHTRMVSDETPYVSTTTRLEHLVKVTRELVAQLTAKTPLLHGASTASSSAITNVVPTKSTAALAAETQVVSSEVAAIKSEIAQLPAAPSKSVMPMLQASWSDPVRNCGLVLIVEESLFYRQMINMAVQSLGFETRVDATVDAAVERLHEPRDFSAILIGTLLPHDVVGLLNRCRAEHEIKVIGLSYMESEEVDAKCFDSQVARSNPRRLREVLTQLLRLPPNDSRKSA